MRTAGLLMVIMVVACAAHGADDPPVIPVGLDGYRMWDKWAQHRIGMRAYMRSTYDRTGGNEAADASHFLHQLAEDYNVTLDVEGPGILYFVRTNHWHGSPWHYVIDGHDNIIAESSTKDPLHPVRDSTFLPASALPAPLTFTWSQTRGADLMWVPMGFEKSLRLAYSRTCYGTGYYIYHHYVGGAKLSQPIKAWDGKTPPDQDVLDLINKSGSDLAALLKTDLREESGETEVGGETPALELEVDQPMVIRALNFSAPKDRALDLSQVWLRLWWDGREQPSVDAPLPLFFGAGTLYNRDNREYLVKAFPMNIRFDAERVHMACYFPMPFFKSMKGQLISKGGVVPDVRWSVRYAPLEGPANHSAYFHATYKDHPAPERGKDNILLDTRNIEGNPDWCGHFIGTSFIFSHDAKLNTLEGDPRFFFDDSSTPQAYGTGTEEWGGGGDYWGGLNMSLPFAGHPTGAKDAASARSPEDKIQSAYRFLLADLMPFGRNARIQLEHGGVNESKEHYETVTYWYGTPGASLALTDELKIGDGESEKSHGYDSPDASEPIEITSRYELGPDKIDGKEIYPAETDKGRTTTGTSEFTLKIRPDNLGVMLRRKLDYSFPNQRAEVSIADASTDKIGQFQSAGIWYLAGSNTCIFSRPKGELDPTEHKVQTSNRRFRDDEFLISRDLVAGKSAIRIRVKFTPVEIPLLPGRPLAKLAWSELRYSAYSFTMPPSP
ncbi:MAG TPA: DUF2961 domain-containing protein [Tepidisphaeraceae bacterium]|jgi:hypothetical protein|nr:DUF2961 domain-containing protein [Tepidisphaeraceae bacterium]